MADLSDSYCSMMEDKEESDFFGSDDEENVAPKKKTAAPKKKNVAPKKKNAAPDLANDEESYTAPVFSSTASNAAQTKKEKTVEEKFQKVSQINHILIRPDTYSEYNCSLRESGCCLRHLGRGC